MRDLDCPSLSTLTTPELCEPDLAAHMASCATCRALGHLAAAPASPGSSRAGCGDIEMLLAAHVSGSALGAADAARLDRHLSQCGGCAATFAAIALDREGLADIAAQPAREETRRVWSRAVEPAAARDALRRRRIAASLAGATALSAAVAAIALLRPTRTEERPAAAMRPTVQPAAVLTPAPASPRVRPRSVLDPELDGEPELPEDAVGAEFRDEAGEALLKAAMVSAADGDYASAFEQCEAALDFLPGHRRTLYVCAIAACRLRKGDSASRYVAAIRNDDKQTTIQQICMQEGLDLDAAKGPPAAGWTRLADADQTASRVRTGGSRHRRMSCRAGGTPQ